MVNLEGGVFEKNGLSNKTFSLSSFYHVGSDFLSDPKILFDSQSNRWFTSLADVTLKSVFVAVSTTSDANGIWTVYRLSAGTLLPDQPIIGISDDKFAVSVNGFISTSFAGTKYWILNKAQMLTGSSVSLFTSTINSGFFSIHPVQSQGPATTQYMVGNIVSGGVISPTTMELFTVKGVPGVSTVTTTTASFTVSSINSPPNGAQPGTTSTINTGDARVQDAIWSRGLIWYTFGDACTPAGDSQMRSCIRLTQIDPTGSQPLVKQDFDYGANSIYFYYPALREDGLGNLEIVYGLSSQSNRPTIQVADQAITDPVGSIGLAQTLKTGSIIDSSNRYGDYFGAGVDPTDPSVIWVAGEYDSSTGGTCGTFGPCWLTFIGSIVMSSNAGGGGGRWVT